MEQNPSDLGIESVQPPAVRNRTSISKLTGQALAGVQRLVDQVFVVPGTKRPKVIVIAGVEPGDGASWITARISEVLADKVSGDCCVVDGNLAAPAVHEYLNCENRAGLSDAILEPGPVRQFAQQVQGNLWMMCSGSRLDQSDLLVDSERFASRMGELRDQFECVLIDVPPLSAGAQALSVARCTDGVILVVRADRTHRDAVRSAVSDLQSANLRVLGTVLNDRTYPVPKKIYSRL